jgi:hypothetical protein
MNRLATIQTAASNFLICAAMDRATCSVSPSAVTWLTSPTESALLALILRPVSKQIADEAVAQIALKTVSLRSSHPPPPPRRNRRGPFESRRARKEP